MSQVQPQRHTFSSSLDFFSTINFLRISADAELAVMKRAGGNHLYASVCPLEDTQCRSDEIIEMITS